MIPKAKVRLHEALFRTTYNRCGPIVSTLSPMFYDCTIYLLHVDQVRCQIKIHPKSKVYFLSLNVAMFILDPCMV